MWWAGGHSGPAMGGKASSSTMRRGAWGQGAWCQGPGHHEEGAALHVAPPHVFRCSTAPGGDVEQPQLGVGWFCAGGELHGASSPPQRLGLVASCLEQGLRCSKGCLLPGFGFPGTELLPAGSCCPGSTSSKGKDSQAGAAAVGFGGTHCGMVCGVHQVLPAGTRGPPGPVLGCTITSCQGPDPRGVKQRLGTRHSFVGICLLLAAGGAGGQGSRTDPCEQTSRVFSEQGR